MATETQAEEMFFHSNNDLSYVSHGLAVACCPLVSIATYRGPGQARPLLIHQVPCLRGSHY